MIARPQDVRTGRLRSERARRAATVAAAILGAVTYSAFLFASLGSSRLSVATSFPSELEATGQPDSGWFRLADAVSGVLIILTIVGVYRLGEVSRRRWPGGALMAAAGAASVTDGITTMACAPSLSASCRARDETVAGLLGQTLEAHTLSGLVGFLGAAGAMVLLGFVVRDRAAAWGRASIATGLVLAGVGLLDLALLVAHGPFGLAERARALLVSLWLLGVAAFLCRRVRPSRLDPDRLAAPWSAGDPRSPG